MGRVFKRGRFCSIAYSYRGKESREGTGSPDRSAVGKLLRARLGEIGQGDLSDAAGRLAEYLDQTPNRRVSQGNSAKTRTIRWSP
jgi:hypothetical protein